MPMGLHHTSALLILAIIVAGSLLVPVSSADEATLRDGTRLQGRLELTEEGRWRFAATNRPAALSAEEAGRVIFPAAALSPLRCGTAHRVQLAGNQHLTGELVGLDEKELRLRTAWSEQLSIPRHALLAVEQLPGWLTFHDDDFETDLKAWKHTGQPALSDRQHTSGVHSLLINTPGQAAWYSLGTPLEAGRAGINFHNPGNTAGARWLFEASFWESDVVRTVKVTVAGESDKYIVEGFGAPDQVGDVPRTPGWHRLELRFSSEYMLIGVDNAVLASWKHGPGGPLRELGVRCVAQAGATAVRGEVFFDDFSLARSLDVLPHRVEDATQDELWLASGDQLFGQVLRADRRTIRFRGRSDTRTFAWGEVRGIFLRREVPPVAAGLKPAPQTTEGEHVRIWPRPGVGAATDELEGVLLTLDDKHVAIRHPLLGKLEIEHGRLHRLDWLFHGRR